jgi:hypothetical protein
MHDILHTVQHIAYGQRQVRDAARLTDRAKPGANFGPGRSIERGSATRRAPASPGEGLLGRLPCLERSDRS